MPLMTWRLGDWLGFYKQGIRNRRRPLSRRVAIERLEPRALLAGTAIVRGVTFIDANGSGDTGQEGDEGEIVVRGIVVTLSNEGNTFNESVTTNANGEFRFFRVPAGTYTLTAQPGTQLTGSTVSVFGVMVDESGEVKENIAMGELKPTVVSLRQFLNTSTTETIPFESAGSGRIGNAIPTVVGTSSSELVFTTSGAAENVDLAGSFTDDDFENSEVQFQTSAGNINVELFDEEAPITVANFYEYADLDRYDDTIFHRLVDNFVLQGGGFSFNDADNTFPEVVEDPMIQNEFSATRSNLASTIAMAKLGGNANSASSQFFFNLGNNSANLDNQNGGFTVFGRIVGTTSTTTVTDSVLNDLVTPGGTSNTAITDQVASTGNSALNALPLDDYSGASFPTDATPDNFLRILDIVTVRRNEKFSYSVVSVNAVAPTTTSPVTAAIVNHRLVITPVDNASGVADIVVRATDLSGESVTRTFKVRVVPAGNTAPVATVALTPAQPLVNSTLTATATATDGDSNPVSLTYVWKVGSTVVKTTPATSSLTDTLNLSTINTEAAGSVITVEVTPTDGFVDGTTVNATRTIAASNSAPTATVALSPVSPLVNSVVTATATATDVNGQDVKLTYVWKVGTTTVKTTSDTSSLTDTLNLSTITEDVVGAVVTVEVTPNDGSLNGTTVSATGTVSNNVAPTATIVSINPTTATPTSTLTATATAADANGQAVTLTYVWRIGANVLKTNSATSNLTDTLNLSEHTINVGDIVTLDVTPSDGTISGTTVSATKTIS